MSFLSFFFPHCLCAFSLLASVIFYICINMFIFKFSPTKVFRKPLHGNKNSHFSMHVSLTPSLSLVPYKDVCQSTITTYMVNVITNKILGVSYEARFPHNEERINRMTNGQHCGKSKITVPLCMFRCGYNFPLTSFSIAIFMYS